MNIYVHIYIWSLGKNCQVEYTIKISVTYFEYQTRIIWRWCQRWIVEEWWMAGSVEDRMDIWTLASFSRSDHLRRRGLLRKKWRTLPLRATRCLSIAIDVGAEKCLKKVLCQKSFAALMEESSMLRNCAGTSLDIFAQFMKIYEILHYITGFAEFDIL